MGTVTTATVGVGAAATVAAMKGNGQVLDVFPAFFPVRFGVEVDAPGTSGAVGSGAAVTVTEVG
jgi:hypothetical protein